MGRRSHRSRRRREQGDGCLGCFGGLLLAIALVIVIYAFLGRGPVSRYVGELIGQQLGESSRGGAGIETLEGQAGAFLPTAVAALPSGELIVTDSEINAYIAANPAPFEPLDEVQLRFTGGQAEADLSAYGMRSTMRAVLVAVDGRIALLAPQIDGPLSVMLSAEELVRSIETQINQELAAQSRFVQEVRVEQGRMVLIVQ